MVWAEAVQTFEKVQNNEITVDGCALAGCECARNWEENPYLCAFKVLTHVHNVETALSTYEDFHQFLDRLPRGAQFTDDEIREWVQWHRMGMRVMRWEQEGECPISAYDIPSLESRFPAMI